MPLATSYIRTVAPGRLKVAIFMPRQRSVCAAGLRSQNVGILRFVLELSSGTGFLVYAVRTGCNSTCLDGYTVRTNCVQEKEKAQVCHDVRMTGRELSLDNNNNSSSTTMIHGFCRAANTTILSFVDNNIDTLYYYCTIILSYNTIDVLLCCTVVVICCQMAFSTF